MRQFFKNKIVILLFLSPWSFKFDMPIFLELKKEINFTITINILKNIFFKGNLEKIQGSLFVQTMYNFRFLFQNHRSYYVCT